MLPSPSQNVTLYLDRATQARAHARGCVLKSERTFYGRLEQGWMDRAAKSAFVDGIDLFAHTLLVASLPAGVCAGCHGIMAIEVIEATAGRESYTLRCGACGTTELRAVQRVTLSDVRTQANVG